MSWLLVGVKRLTNFRLMLTFFITEEVCASSS